jgi:hypothetical protein
VRALLLLKHKLEKVNRLYILKHLKITDEEMKKKDGEKVVEKIVKSNR